jgi:tRNA pseudouridine13 synthase
MRIKTVFDDFFVEEVLHFAPSKKEMPFRVFLLEKEGWNTADALREAAAARGVPLTEVRSVGKKDRHAHTLQYVSVPSQYDLACEGKGFSVRFAGYSNAHLAPAVLKGNRFSVLLRDMEQTEAGRCEARLQEVSARGFVNYFDDQRFGNVGEKGEFLAEMLVKRRFGPALRKYFSFRHPDAPLPLKRRKALLAAMWGKWEEMAPFCPEPLLKEMLTILRKRGEAGYRACLKLIPAPEMGLYFSAYQSFLWNETLSRFLAKQRGDLFLVSVRTGELLQYRMLPEPLLSRLASAALPTAAPDMPPLEPDIGEVFSALLFERGVRLSKFRLKEMEQAYFSSFPRACTVVPGDASWKREEDPLFPGKNAMRVNFFLPRGSYATMMLKAVAPEEASIVQDPRT